MNQPSQNDPAGDPAPPTRAELAARIAEVMLVDRRRLSRRLLSAGRQPRAGFLADLSRQVARAEEKLSRRQDAVPTLSFPPELPVSDRAADLATAISVNQVVIVAGETGSGKSTQLPKICLSIGRGVLGMIGHTQPRRIAARALAERIAEETGTTLGEAIGYSIRFGDHTGPNTLVKLMTDGILLAEITRDRLLSAYDTIIIDEAHERSLNIDFLLGYLVGLLPRRPELKVIITSATIDPQRFSQHFSDAPIIEVSGRMFPVEIRYRPFGAEETADDDEAVGPVRRGRPPVKSTPDTGRDLGQAICDATDELAREGDGDVLVFLSGEREITDTAEVLRGHLAGRPGVTEVLPLYGRLSMADQHKVFADHPGRRIVLSTNVAETSLTVPGIRYVIDPGTARISRYSPRTKVQRLPIERISQASAGQRAGRCGRVADGICIRLYSEEDFDLRSEYTDPEIARTSLAAVILKMASLDLGEIDSFPFLDPPDSRQITDGITVLTELGALEPAESSGRIRLTGIGKSLAELPVDPRLARMIVEAADRGCLAEMLVVTSALAIQDVREYPLDARDKAGAAHARFTDPKSDFLSTINLWHYLQIESKGRSGNAFRRMCKSEYLHYLRIREWQDLHAQLRQIARGLKMDGLDRAVVPGDGTDSRAVHTAVLAGLLSHVGLRLEPGKEYQGTRGSKFMIWPGSPLAKSPPRLVVAAELIETSRLWARVAAAIEPEWAEDVGGDLLRRNYSEPRWEARRGSVAATEKVMLLGVTLIGARTVQYDRIDPVLSRELFIRHALVEGDWETRHAFFAANRRTLDEIAEHEDRVRRRDIVLDDEALFELYDARIPAEVTSARHFDSWWRKASREDPDRLTFSATALTAAGAAGFDPAAYPDRYTSGGMNLGLDYVFDPARADDGVSVTIPLAVLARVDPARFDAQIPGLRTDLAVALIRSLPKSLRRNFVPAPDFAAAALAQIPDDGRELSAALAATLTAMTGVRLRNADFDLAKVPDHLRLTFKVVDESGRSVAAGKDLGSLQDALRAQGRQAVAKATGSVERTGLTEFPTAGLARELTTSVARQQVVGYPALVDEGETVGVKIFTSADDQARAMRAGTRRLLAIGTRSQLSRVKNGLTRAQQLTLAATPYGPLAALLADATNAAIDALLDWAGGPAFTPDGYARLAAKVGRELDRAVIDVVVATEAVLVAANRAAAAIEAVTGPATADSYADMRAELTHLLRPGFIAATTAAHLPDLARFLQALAIRAQRVTANPERDRQRMNEINHLAGEIAAAVGTLRPERTQDSEVVALWRLLAEYRVALFAQPLRTAVAVSAKRILQAIAAIAPV